MVAWKGLTMIRALLVTALLAPSLAQAEESSHAPSTAVTADVELDPIAYALDGYSLHVGINRDHLRLDLGAYALAIPAWVHGQEGFDASFDGYGAKLQYFLRGDRLGAFAGIGGGVARVRIERDGLAARETMFSAGAHVGYRFAIAKGIYATPWIGVDYAFDPADVMLGGERFEGKHWSVFPTVHLGYRFE
jgi:hypothetical protein